MPMHIDRYTAYSRGISVLGRGETSVLRRGRRKEVTWENGMVYIKRRALWNPVVGYRMIMWIVTFTNGCCERGRCCHRSKLQSY